MNCFGPGFNPHQLIECIAVWARKGIERLRPGFSHNTPPKSDYGLLELMYTDKYLSAIAIGRVISDSCVSAFPINLQYPLG